MGVTDFSLHSLTAVEMLLTQIISIYASKMCFDSPPGFLHTRMSMRDIKSAAGRRKESDETDTLCLRPARYFLILLQIAEKTRKFSSSRMYRGVLRMCW
jgi:hypothetical protein